MDPKDPGARAVDVVPWAATVAETPWPSTTVADSDVVPARLTTTTDAREAATYFFMGVPFEGSRAPVGRPQSTLTLMRGVRQAGPAGV
jgi:hypothetical protein